MSEPGGLEHQFIEFVREVTGLLYATLPGLPDVSVELLRHDDRFVMRPPDGKPLPLYVGGQHLANMKMSMACELDSVGRFMAVKESTFDLLAVLDRTPVIRIHYRRGARIEPAAHVHVHGHRGALTHLLSQAGHVSPHDISSLHIPVGGNRFRPCLEDFIEFLIVECKFDAQRGWRRHVAEGRERWRRRQAAAVVRDVPEVAAKVLRDLGYNVEAPTPVPADTVKALRNW